MGSLRTIGEKQSLQLVASTSNGSIDVPSQSSSMEEENVRLDNLKEVEQLSERVRIMEEETEILKAVFWATLEERSRSMAEVHEEVHNCLLLGRRKNGQEFLDKVSTIKSSEERGAGMLQLLGQDSNPLLLKRKISIKM